MAAILLVVEAVGLVIVNVALGKIADAQSMSLAGLDPDVMSTSSFVLAGVVFLYLGACALILLLSAIRGRSHGRFARILLISAAVLHAVLGALTVGMVGWPAFVFMMVMFGLLVLSLMGYEKQPAGPEDAPPAPAGGDGAPQAA
ncbi:hypothetical protein SAMN05421806_107150 [Streptomyces indicus]|uniref:Uncharacterized protein n=1 Tax=Streptomyces indicus TaxID=417292 RepID=A0A1G9BN01_9ACTN|nr:hypothetical protein SAMN05421806_107150 [Streptomyces indicus]